MFACRLHFQEAEPVAGERRRDLGDASAGGGADQRHHAEVGAIPGNDIAAIHFAAGAKLIETFEITGAGGLGAVFHLEMDQLSFDKGTCEWDIPL